MSSPRYALVVLAQGFEEIEVCQEEIRNYELEITKCRDKVAKAVNKVWGADED